MNRYRHRKNPRTEDDDFRVFLDYVSGIDSVEFLAEAHNIPVASVEMILDVYLDKSLDDSQELRFNPSGRLPKFTEAQKEEIAEKYRNDESHTLASLALEYNCSAPTIKTILIQKNASLRAARTTQRAARTTHKKLTPAQELNLISRYENEPSTTVESLTTDFSISIPTLYGILKRHGSESTRPQGLSRALTSTQERELITRYKEDPDPNIKMLASDFSISQPMLHNILKRHGVERSRPTYRPASAPDLTLAEELELIKRYQEEPDTRIETLCSEYSIPQHTLYRVLKRHGIELTRGGQALSPLQEIELIKRYQDEPDTKIETLTSDFSISIPTLNNILKRHGIQRSRRLSAPALNPAEELVLTTRYQEEPNTTKDYTILYADEMRKLSNSKFVDKFGISAKQIDAFDFAWRFGVAVASEKEFVIGVVSNAQLVAALFVPETAPDCFSFDIVVAPEFRGQGLASLLVDYAEAIFHEMSASTGHMPYCIAVINEDMKNILERKGFRVYKTFETPGSYNKRFMMTK